MLLFIIGVLPFYDNDESAYGDTNIVSIIYNFKHVCDRKS